MGEYYGIQRSPDYLAHYGVKGMKWGVQRAKEYGSQKKLDRVYRKAYRKLERLHRQANNGERYARRADRLGLAGLAAGTLAVVGPNNFGKGISAIGKIPQKLKRGGFAGNAGGNIVTKAGDRLSEWSNNTSLANRIANFKNSRIDKQLAAANVGAEPAIRDLNILKARQMKKANLDTASKTSNNRMVRLGAAAAGAGLLGAAGYNAYRAATTGRAAEREKEWRREMANAFKGTSYERLPDYRAHRKARRRSG